MATATKAATEMVVDHAPSSERAAERQHIRVAGKVRNADGHVCGETHHRAGWPDWVVNLARDIAAEKGWGARRVTYDLHKRGVEVSLSAVESWLSFERRLFTRPTGA